MAGGKKGRAGPITINRHAADPRSAFAQEPHDARPAREAAERTRAESTKGMQRVGTMQRVRKRYPLISQEDAFRIADGEGVVGPDGRYLPND